MTTVAPAEQATMRRAPELPATARGDTGTGPAAGRAVPDAGRRTGVTALAGAHRLRIDDSTRIGPDPRVTATARDSAASGGPTTTAAGRGPAPSRREH